MHFVSCRYVTYREGTGTFVDDHPLRKRFEHDAVVPVSDPGKFIQLHVNSVFFRRAIIVASALQFDERVRPTFEDGHFVCRFMMRCPGGSIGFVRGARYYYRKRADRSSTLDTSSDSLERFDDMYRYGYCAVLQEARESLGAVPRWLQRTVLYDVVWQIRRYLNHEEKLAFLDARQMETYKSLLRQVFKSIDSSTISRFELANIRELHRIGLLGMYKSVCNKRSYCFIDELDAGRGTFVLRWYAPKTESKAKFRIDGAEVVPLESKEQIHTLFHEPFFYENRVRIRRSVGVLTADIGEEAFSISVFGRGAVRRIDLADVFAMKLATTTPVRLSWRAARVRRISQSPAVKGRYENAWVLMDRDVEADDNGEHLYRFLRRTRDDINAYFVLRRDSKDWRRLEAEGFRLIAFGSVEHEYALLNARYLVSSHADAYVWRYLPEHEYRDLIKYKFVFLQHGVLFHDLASWMNTIPIDLMVASCERERDAVAGRSNRYKLMPSQVQLTGMPRHDALLRSASQPERHILLMPTWRNSLVGRRVGQGTQRELNDAFAETDFARAWKAVLHSPRLKSLADVHGYRITFFPHTNVEPYVAWFDISASIELQSRAGGASIQEAFKRSRLLITDYSSVAFEMALLGRGVLYYQFDRERIFTGIHSVREGYFDCARDGFGPVCLDLETLLDQLERALANDGQVDAMYAQRARDTFAWRDGHACRRTVQAIERLEGPVVVRPARRPVAIEAIAAGPEILVSQARASRM